MGPVLCLQACAWRLGETAFLALKSQIFVCGDLGGQLLWWLFALFCFTSILSWYIVRNGGPVLLARLWRLVEDTSSCCGGLFVLFCFTSTQQDLCYLQACVVRIRKTDCREDVIL